MRETSRNVELILSACHEMGPVARLWERRGAYKILVVKLEGKRPIGRPRRRWENNIKIDLKQIILVGVD
jgi:hypothetical protein